MKQKGQCVITMYSVGSTCKHVLLYTQPRCRYSCCVMLRKTLTSLGPHFLIHKTSPLQETILKSAHLWLYEAGKVLIYQTVTFRVHFQRIRSHGHIPALAWVDDSISQNSTHTYVFRSMWMAEPRENHLDSPEEESQINQHFKWRFVYKYETLIPSQPQTFSARLFPQLSTCVQETFGEMFMVDVRPLLRPR